MTQDELFAEFAPLYMSFVNLVELQKRPLLAHYTSLEAIEKIARSGELWFSNPLFMNDLQEVRFGLLEGQRLLLEEFADSARRDAIGGERADALRDAFLAYFADFDRRLAIDMYVFCLTEHEADDHDGLLSMWRGYGGNGAGAAVVVSTSFVAVRDDSPIFIGRVKYGTDEQRRAWIRGAIGHTTDLVIKKNIEGDILQTVSYFLFEVLKVNALLSKHAGFREEREWRVIYFPERDTQKIFGDKYTYIVGKRGIEPKLRFPMQPLPFEEPNSWTFDGIVDRIILGPSLSSVLATNAVKKMFDAVGRKAFADRVVGSTIPFRPTDA